MKIPRSSFSAFRSLSAALLLAGGFSGTTSAALVVLGPGDYTQNFNSVAFTSNEPVAGWDLRTAATASSLGGGGLDQRQITAVFAWNHTGGAFKSVSSTNIARTSTLAEQNANLDRALAFNQVNAYGDPGASFNFHFSTGEVVLNSISIDLLLLNNNANRSTTLSIQYGLGANPSSFTTLGTWSDQDVVGGWGSTTLRFDRSDFGASLDGQSQAWFRVVALNPSAGAGGTRDQIGIDNFSMNASAVPEPSTVALGVVGVLAAFLVRRRLGQRV